MLTKEEFTELLTPSMYFGNNRNSKLTELEKRNYYNAFFGESVVTHGSSGGSCWGGVSESFSTGNSASKEIPELVEFLTAHIPDMPFLTYHKILDKISTIESSNNEYYGNYTVSQTAYLTHDDLITAIYG